MVEFSTAPYQFFDPKPLKPVIALSRPINRLLLRYSLSVKHREITGQVDRVRQLLRSGARILFTPNHPSRTDPQLMGDVHRQLGTHSSFMAAYDVFLENPVQRWFMQRTGAFSIDRDGHDRKSMATAIDILREGDMSLTIFPEGNVYHLNDRVTPILDGPAFIATKAQQSLKEGGDVWIVPVSLKYTQLTDLRDILWSQLEVLQLQSGYRGPFERDEPLNSVRSIGAHLISRLLKSGTGFTGEISFEGMNREEIQDQILDRARQLIGALEKDLELVRDDGEFVLNRMRKIRTRVHQLRSEGEAPDEDARIHYQKLAARSMFAFRLLAYVIPYLADHPTIDRYTETVTRIREDYYSRSFLPLAPRKAMVKIGEPISVPGVLGESGGKTRPAIASLSGRIEKAIQAGIDEMNQDNREIGAQLIG